MDGHRFDELTRAMATGTTRRRALRLTGGGLAAGLLSLAGAGQASADDTPKPLGKKCRKDAQCASGFCDPESGTCAAPPPTSTSQQGELVDGDATFSRCGADGNYYYDTYTYTHGGGPLSIGLRGAHGLGGTLPDPQLYLYSSFDPAAPCANLLGEDDDSGCGLDAYLSFADLPAGTYTIVATSFFSVESGYGSGSYTLETNIPPAC